MVASRIIQYVRDGRCRHYAQRDNLQGMGVVVAQPAMAVKAAARREIDESSIIYKTSFKFDYSML